MSIAGLQGRAYTDPDAPEAPGVCDSCNFKYLFKDLHWQYNYRGDSLQNLWIKKCPRCLDIPSEFLRPVILPPDPMPIINARPGFYASQEGPPPNPNTVDEIAQEIDQA